MYISKGSSDCKFITNFYKFFIAIGTGFGFRYDFGLFLLRLDLGFKTHNPVLPIAKRWNLNYNLKNANPTIGINYPF